MQTPIQTLETDQLVTHDVEFGGQKLRVSNFTNDRLINDSLANEHVWEPWQLNLMSRIIKPESICIDVGANVGINAMFAGRFCPQGRVIAYEPFQAIYRVLEQNVRQNHLDNVLPVNKGLSNSRTSLEMITDVLSVGGAHVVHHNAGGEQYAKTMAHFARLDDEMHELGIKRIDFIKIDVEGHEMKVLEGGQSFLLHPDLQMTIEFSPVQHFRAALSSGPFIDRPLFEKLKSWFKHVFILNRDKTLQKMQDWHLLRRRLMGAFYVDDLYCANTIRPEVQTLIVEGSAAAPHVEVQHEQIGSLFISYYNRDRDGWAMADNYNPAVVSVTIDGPLGRDVTLVFNPIWQKHLPDDAKHSNWPVWVMIGPESHRVDLLNNEREIKFQTIGAPLNITIESEHRTFANSYLGNPSDPRQIGFRFVVKP